jgi:two-component system, cell cycle sensor histidine kinase and response regulator CckA
VRCNIITVHELNFKCKRNINHTVDIGLPYWRTGTIGLTPPANFLCGRRASAVDIVPPAPFVSSATRLLRRYAGAGHFASRQQVAAPSEAPAKRMSDFPEVGKQPVEFSEALLAMDRAVLGVLSTGASLGHVLTVLCMALEQQAPGLLCSVLLLNQSGTHLLQGAAPSLPAAYNRAVDGFAIGPRAGSCGTAAYRQETVIVSDIANDPLWHDYREVALQYGLRACWSSPVISRAGGVLGTFAIYYREARSPTDRDRHLVAWSTQLAGIAIERKHAEDHLERQREELQIILDAAPAMIWYKDTEDKILRANRAAAESLGLPRHEIEGRSGSELFLDQAEKYRQDDLEVMRSGQPKLGIHRQVCHPASGQQRWLIADKIPYRDLDGRIIGVIVFVRDITPQHLAEAALQEAGVRFKTLVEKLPGIIYIAGYGLAGPWKYVSPRIQESLGFAPEEWISNPQAWGQQVHPEDRARVLAEEALSRETGKDFVSEYRMLTRDGRVVWFRDEACALRDNAGQPDMMQGVMLDITERKNLEERLRQAQKMEAVGRLAGGVAHDFNNALMVIHGYSEMLLESLPPTAVSQRKSAEEIRRASSQAAASTRQLLAFSRMQVLQPEMLDLNTLLTEMCEILRRLLGPGIELILHPGADLGWVKADQSHIEQVILNLAVNARDAMPHGGKLTLSTSRVELEERVGGELFAMPPGRYVVLMVTDTGIGMDAQTKAHVFEPFFTTKERGKGTGLGLATVYGIVQQSGGWIWVYSEPGQGTSFKIYLPGIAEEIQASGLAKTRLAAVGGSETILLVEDEEAIQELLHVYLTKLGYAVLCAGDGSAALRIAEQHPDPIHLLVSDLAMPKMGGYELARRLRFSNPRIKIMFISGYAEPTPTHRDEIELAAAYLAKPFTFDLIAKRIREVLELRADRASG